MGNKVSFQSCAPVPYGCSVFRMEHETVNKIKKAMVLADRSQAWTARRAGIPSTTFDRKLRCASPFTIPEVWRIAEALNIPPVEILPSDLERVPNKVAA